MPKNAEGKSFVVGTKQTLKLMQEGSLTEVFLAEDADLFVTKEIEELASEKEIQITKVESMKKLGKQFGISVGAAAAGLLKEI